MMDEQKTRGVSKATGSGLFGRGSLKALTISMALAFGAVPIQVSAQETPMQISIPAQSLSNALIQLGEQASLQIFYLPETVSGLNAPAVAGSLTPDQALQRLLAGTGIEFKRNGNSVSLSKPASGGATQLAPIMVQGSLDATTEGTGTYAAQAVTIGKGTYSLREIPQSVTVITNKQLQDQNIQSVAEAVNQVPGVTISDTEYKERFWSRGFQMTTQQDGIPFEMGNAAYHYRPNLALFDRIEILRGPTGLLTGTGEPGGSVNFVRKMPRSEFSASGALTAGSWNHYQGELDVTGPLNNEGTLRGRAVMAYQTKDTFYGAKDNKDNLFYGVIQYDLTPRTNISLGASYLKRDYTLSYGLPLYTDGTGLPRDAFVGSDKLSSHTDKDIYIDFNHEFLNAWKLKGAYNYKKSEMDTYVAQAQSQVDPVTGLGSMSIGRTVAEAEANSWITWPLPTRPATRAWKTTWIGIGTVSWPARR
ncbi:MAG TPA: TonB-dependent receptor plug domain-containing protein [Burkholderiaceae bacterium]|nr:TonB-dependent receptor plug domain-containing protein [Burkholderiaceae bacterium]